MNLTLGNFDELVRFIHPIEVRGARTAQNDAVLQRIGSGVAGYLQTACQRLFGRVAGDTYEAPSHGVVVLPRYPLESITKVEIAEAYGSPWQEALGVIDDVDSASGTVGLLVSGRVRLTYTGGYWCETLEPGETGYPSAMPEGATPVPDDLRWAWLLACQHCWEHKDHWIPKTLGGNEKVSPLALGDMAAIPAVAETIAAYRRMHL